VLWLSLCVAPLARGQVDGPTPDKGANGEQSRPRMDGAAAGPLETGKKNVPEFEPAFAGQTRAQAVRTRTPLQVTELASGFNQPWALAFLPEQRILVTEKPEGALYVVEADGPRSRRKVAGVPRVDGREQGGLLDVLPARDFERSQQLYLSYYEPRKGGNGLAVARARLTLEPKPKLSQRKVVFRMQPTIDSARHAGGRLVWGADENLFITLGDRYVPAGRKQAQDPKSHVGKIIRVRPDGTAPPDNPLVQSQSGRSEIWTLGHRNVLGADLDAKGRLWAVEMGPRGGDELNLIERGKDYGWPTIGYGEEYSGAPIHQATRAEGLTQPVYYWDPVISPSSLAIYKGALFPEWQGNFLIGGLSSRALIRLVLRDDRVVGEERLLMDLGARIREVAEGPDGAIYLLTDDAEGKLLKLTPAPKSAH
jgi:glucose/arabinose dehydrogenase